MKRTSGKSPSRAASTDDVAIRRATRDDVAAIVRMFADDALGRTRERLTDPLPASYDEAFAAIDASPNDELVVAAAGEQVIGTLQITYVRHLSFRGALRAQLEGVHVDAAWRGRGVGALLVRWAVERARQRGCRMVQLTSHKSRADAHRFYQRLGFVASHEGMKIDLGPG